MNNDTINKLNEFQNILKKCMLDRFSGIISKEKENILTSSNYLDINELKDKKTALELQGFILRKMLKSIVNIKCKKNLAVNGTTKSVNYGTLLEELIIEYYAKEMSRRYLFDIDKNENLDAKASILNEIKKILDYNFDIKVLNNNALSLLEMNELSEYKALFDVQAIDEEEKKLMQNKIDENSQIDISNFANNISSNNTNNNDFQSNEEYENLVMKYARGEALSEEELKKLVAATPELNQNPIEIINQDNNENISMSNGGFSYIKMTIYFLIITNILGFIIATLLINY